MTDNFFNRIDTELQKQGQDEEQKATRVADAEALARDAISEATAVLKPYRDKLATRAISTNLEGGSTTLRLKMVYGNGDIHDLYFGLDRDAAALHFVSYHVDENGSRYSATDAARIRRDQWTIGEFTRRLEKHIEDYIFYAKRHGGTA